MERVRLGRTEAQVSMISLGTWSHGGPNTVGTRDVGWSGFDRQKAADSLVEAHACGINHWDTADVYGSGGSETLIGEAFTHVPRDQVFLASKVGWDPGPHRHFYHPDWIRHQLEASLRRLKTEYLDLYYLHHCQFGADDRYLDDALEVLSRAKERGDIRFIGLSDWDSSAIMRVIERVDPDVVQPYRNLLSDAYMSSGLSAWVAQHDIGAAFFSPLRHGLLLGKYEQATTFPEGDFRSSDAGFQDQALITALRQNADRLKSRFPEHAQPVIFGLVAPMLADGPNACVLLGQRNSYQVRAAASVAQSMSPEDAQWVRGIYESLR
jgi:aryl-alcohol dehydrogenase-like predicted oxidoreductase